jgi:hypothetical protein
MNPERKRILREQWPHIAEDIIAVDEAADKWLKWRADLYRRKKEKRSEQRLCHNDSAAAGRVHGRDPSGPGQ